ncbi:hypothetical protein JTB14_036182 [Gonioctena quinquepunctata]|nr:hypothetical protein JTB14_036182 [Gonioctena quinquepunctata]
MRLLSVPLHNLRNNIYFFRSSSVFCPKTAKPPWNVLFFGTDEFSLHTLKSLCSESLRGTLLKNLEVVTISEGKNNPVWKFAKKEKLVIHNWPIFLEDISFHVGVVVSFGRLIPESIIQKFSFGMLNVHASLLPRWRGAAPIIYALANGDKETGVTIMQIKPRHFDVGEIVMQEKLSIAEDMCMPQLHLHLAQLGAKCLVNTLKNLPEALKTARSQSNEGVTLAPKVKPEFAVVNWNIMHSKEVYNLYRALKGFLSPITSWNGAPVKLQDIEECSESVISDNELLEPGYVKYDKTSKKLRVTCANRTSISVSKIGIFGKKVMSANDFNNGFLKKVSPLERYFK